MAPVGTAITGTRGAVPSGTPEGKKLRAVRSTGASEGTFTVSTAFQREAAFMREESMKSDLLSDRRFVLANGLSNGSFGRAIGNTGEDDTPFIQSEMRK